MKFTLLSASVISALALLPGAHAWGKEGHAIVATIAELHLDPTVLPTLCSILNPSRPGGSCSLASVASWADEIRNRMKWSGPMHYANAVADHPPQLCLFPGAKGWEGDVNVLKGIRNTTDLLSQWVQQGSDLSDPIASEALKFLIHFAGDMHMPFHLVGRARGANDIFVKWGNRKVKLHGMWDGNLVDRAIETTPSDWEQQLGSEIEHHLHGDHYDPLIRKVLVQGINQTWAGEVQSWVQCPAASSALPRGDDQTVLQSQREASDTDDGSVCPWHWASPIHQLTCDWVWPKQLEQPPYNDHQGPLLELDTDEYGGKITREWVVEKLLTMGGIRLASILNLIFTQQKGN
ncbi:phospholipase C/P1 nuclease [Thelephora ganbajun]|uniref:Phospholipase C/P1 nuclease n=1 Tax=Thelephora ganbajun TaxID=370292 RepID=A0ACB6ZFH0_THEGA|nr:phospholipase C/P1 nuclease [Thelephora ganbajun]